MDIARIASRILKASAPMEPIFMTAYFPEGMGTEQVIAAVHKLVPCETGTFDLVESDVDWLTGFLDCETTLRDSGEPHNEYGPDSEGVSVVWSVT